MKQNIPGIFNDFVEYINSGPFWSGISEWTIKKFFKKRRDKKINFKKRENVLS